MIYPTGLTATYLSEFWRYFSYCKLFRCNIYENVHRSGNICTHFLEFFIALSQTTLRRSVLVVLICYLLTYSISYIYYFSFAAPYLWWIKIIITCSAILVASSGMLKPSCSRYLVSVMTQASAGSKFNTNWNSFSWPTGQTQISQLANNDNNDTNTAQDRLINDPVGAQLPFPSAPRSFPPSPPLPFLLPSFIPTPPPATVEKSGESLNFLSGSALLLGGSWLTVPSSNCNCNWGTCIARPTRVDTEEQGDPETPGNEIWRNKCGRQASLEEDGDDSIRQSLKRTRSLDTSALSKSGVLDDYCAI